MKLIYIFQLFFLISCGTNYTASTPKNGTSSLIISTPITSPCIGMMFSTYLDKNNNGLGEPFEKTSSYNLCSVQGSDGKDGTSVVFEQLAAPTCINGGNIIMFASDVNYNGIFDAEDEDMRQITLCNGMQGPEGKPAEFSPVTVIDPCGNANNIVDEVFLRLDKNTIVAYYEDGNNRRLAVLEENILYKTTDGANSCKFKIINGEIVKY